MPPQEQHRLANVFILLIAIDKRVNIQQAQTKKAKKVNIRKGSLTCGPSFYTPPWPARPASPYSLFLIPLMFKTSSNGY